MPTKAELEERIKALTEQNKELEKQIESSSSGSGGNKVKKVKVKRKPSPYALFVKENFASVKEEFPDDNASVIMKKIAKKWNDQKTAAGQA